MLPSNQRFYRPYEMYEKKDEGPLPKYEPYKSDSEDEAPSDTDSGSVTTTTSSQEELPNFAVFATNLQLNEAGGQNLPTTAAQLEYGLNEINREVPYSAYTSAFTIDLPFDKKKEVDSGDKIWKDDAQREKKTVTSVIMLNSRDRDRNVYPTPANLTLRLPRVYLNVVSMQIIQMKLLSSFLYFRIDKSNTSITINEFGRIFYNYLNEAKGILNITKYIREGSYNINTLIAELTIQLNTPPIFYDFPGGFNQFVPLFVASGGYFGIAFNYPGDYFYDSLNRQYTAAPTMNFIITRYWATTTLGFTPNLNQTKVAYYYPVLREYVLDPEYGIDDLNTNIDTSALLPGETLESRILYSFQGVNDPIIQALIDANVIKLDIYRSLHTFRNSLVNKYVVGYETFNNRIYIQSPSLNTSLVNLLNAQYQIYFNQQLSNYGLTSSSYNQLITLNNQILSILNSMYDYIQRQMAIYFGIDFNTYAPVYFTQPYNYIGIQNGLNAIGVSSNYDINVIARGNTAITSNIIELNRHDPVTYWPNMSNMNIPYNTNVDWTGQELGIKGYPFNLGEPILGDPSITSNFPYDITLNNFDFSNSFIDIDGDVFTDIRRKAGDIIVPIEAGRYTVFRFRSLYRQTLQIETLPRPTQYRYPAYNAANYGLNIRTFFDNSYSFVFNTVNQAMDNVLITSLSNIYGFNNPDVNITTNFGIDFSNSRALWGSNKLSLNSGNTVMGFVFYLPNVPSPPVAAPAYKHRIDMTLANYDLSQNIPSALNLYLYHDRAAFMADITTSGKGRNQIPLNYNQMLSFSGGSPSTTLTWNAYAGQTYYAILRSQNLAFPNVEAQLVLSYPDGSSNYISLSDSINFNPWTDPTTDLNNFNFAQVADPDFIRLPISSNLWGSDPTGNEVNRPLVISNVAIGYDSNDISSDLTDYISFKIGYTYIADSSGNIDISVKDELYAYDPINGFNFFNNSPYNITTQTYFYSGSSNFIVSSNGQSNYTPGVVNYRQFKIINWFDHIYLPDTEDISSSDLSEYIAPYSLEITGNIPISNYDYNIATSNIRLGDGCCGFSFVPDDGVWNIERVVLRSAFIENDKNDNIAFLGVFLTSQVNSIPSSNLYITDAIAKLNFTRKSVYGGSNPLSFLGFDGLLGTYYEFKEDTTFQQGLIAGFSQVAGVFNTNSQNYYSLIAFDANSNVTKMHALTGSPVPYPKVCDASAAIYYFDGKAAPNRKGIVVPFAPPDSNADPVDTPPLGGSYLMPQYQLSIQIGTQITHYLDKPDIIDDLSGFIVWNGINYAPSQMYANVPGVIMIQSSDFKFYSYPYNTTTRNFTYLFNLTIDEIYPTSESTVLVAAAGNSTDYVFLGFTIVASSYKLRLKKFNIETSVLSEISIPSTLEIPDLTFSINTFSFTDKNGIVLSGTSGGTSAVTYRTPDLSTSFFVDTYPAQYINVKSIQTPNSDTVYSLPLNASGLSENYFYSVKETDNALSRNTITIVPDAYTPTYFSNFCVTTLGVNRDQILFTSPEVLPFLILPDSQARTYKVQNITGTAPALNATLAYSKQVFNTKSPVNPVTPVNIIGGALGSRWAFFNQPYYIMGNRNDTEDAAYKIQNAWQIFYPTMKLIFRKLGNAVNPIIDLSGLKYPEYPHTMMFAYNTLEGYSKQLGSNLGTARYWGQETSGGLLPVNPYNLNSNGYLVSDPNFSGFYFNSYIFNVPLLPSAGTSLANGNPEPYYYIVLRNYAPSEKSQVLLRFNMPQRYDFGFVRIADLSNEPLLLQSNTDLFNPSYTDILLNFQSNFFFVGRNFGYNPTLSINGAVIDSSGFGDFIRQYTTYYNLYSSNAAIINAITSNTLSNLYVFIQENLPYILPEYAQTRANYTAALQFSILWRSSLTPKYLQAEDEWGLGWNLGYAKMDTPYATIARAESFYKILDDYIYLKLNTEYDMNRMDFGGKENLKETLEPQGQILGYNAKLLLNTFGSYAQTIIQNPVYFTPPFMKLDKMTFQWYDVAGTLITNPECEWNAAIQIVEEVPSANLRGKNPVIIP